jgi:hypothetical protein
MGINAEMIRLVAELRRRDALIGDRVIELGAQDVCAAPEVISSILAEERLVFESKPSEHVRANLLYSCLGLTKYTSIDASGGNGALAFDLNRDLNGDYQYSEAFDLVTNLGTSEHCFNQYAVFKNMHDLCNKGGLMIHALTVQGNVNHGFYNYHPRFVADLAAANHYDIVRLAFTVDYRPDLIEYSLETFKKWDSHDVLLYAVLQKTRNEKFVTPFDGMFASANKLDGYASSQGNPLESEFSPYLKGGNWENTRGFVAPQPTVGFISRLRSAIRRRLQGRG